MYFHFLLLLDENHAAVLWCQKCKKETSAQSDIAICRETDHVRLCERIVNTSYVDPKNSYM